MQYYFRWQDENNIIKRLPLPFTELESIDA